MIRSLAVYGKKMPVTNPVTPGSPQLVLEKTVVIAGGAHSGRWGAADDRPRR